MRSIDAIAIAALLLVPSVAHADPDLAIGLEGTLAVPLADDDVQLGAGGGVAVFLRDPDLEGIGLQSAFGTRSTFGLSSDRPVTRDVHDLHADLGLSVPLDPIAISGLVGLDVLVIDEHDGGATHRGTTLGANLTVAIEAPFSSEVRARVSATYVSAVLPGSGQSLSTFVASFTLLAGIRREPDEHYPPPPPPPPPPTPPTPPRPPTPVSTLPESVRQAASSTLGCAEVSGALEGEVRLGCETPRTDIDCSAQPILYRTYRAQGCGRDRVLQCYELADGVQQCMPQ